MTSTVIIYVFFVVIPLISFMVTTICAFHRYALNVFDSYMPAKWAYLLKIIGLIAVTLLMINYLKIAVECTGPYFFGG